MKREIDGKADHCDLIELLLSLVAENKTKDEWYASTRIEAQVLKYRSRYGKRREHYNDIHNYDYIATEPRTCS